MDHITAMAIFTRTARACILLAGGGLALFTACQPTEPSSCSDDPLPAFAITVRAADGPLPANTLIRLAYGGGMEEFALEAPPAPDDERVMFCNPHGTPTAAGAGGETATAPTEALFCELWVEGAATLWVTGADYPELVEELQGEANECGAETVEAELVLGATHTDSSGE